VDIKEIRRQKDEEFLAGGTCGPTRSNHSSKMSTDKEAAKNKNYLVLQAKHKLDLAFTLIL
jgi:hypothetical protein